MKYLLNFTLIIILLRYSWTLNKWELYATSIVSCTLEADVPWIQIKAFLLSIIVISLPIVNNPNRRPSFYQLGYLDCPKQTNHWKNELIPPDQKFVWFDRGRFAPKFGLLRPKGKTTKCFIALIHFAPKLCFALAHTLTRTHTCTHAHAHAYTHPHIHALIHAHTYSRTHGKFRHDTYFE